MRALLFLACLVLVPSTVSAREVLTVADVMRDRVALDGKVVTVRGIFTHGYQGPFLLLDLDTPRIDKEQHLIKLNTKGNSYSLHRLSGRLQRSLVLVTGKIVYVHDCDYRDWPVAEREYVSTNCFVVDLERLRRIRILDTIAADDPRARHKRLRPDRRTLVPFPESDPEYFKIADLARKWRKGILNGDVLSLARLSDDPYEPLSEKTRLAILTDTTRDHYNIIFHGRDSLQNRMRRNQANPIHIGFIHEEHTSGGSAYADLHICYCLREECGERERESLKYASGQNLADPYWCFRPFMRKNGKWMIQFYG